MLAPNHAVFGSSLTLFLLGIFGVSMSLHWTIILIAILGSLMPDIDMPKSTIGRLIPFISVPLERRFGHRTITHSLIGWLIATVGFGVIILIATPITNNFYPDAILPHLPLRWIAAFSIGYMSHIILDMFNPRGAQLFWPNPVRDVVPGNPKFRIKSGSKAEIVVFLGLIGLLLLSFPISQYGLVSSLRWLLASPDSAIQEFKKADTYSYAEFKGVFTKNRSQIEGTVEVVGAEKRRLLVRLTPKQIYFPKKSASQTPNPNIIYTLSNELDADIMASTVRLLHTDHPLQIDEYHFNTRTQRQLLRRVPKDALVSGTITLPEG